MSVTYAQLSMGGNNDKDTVKKLQILLNQNGASLTTDGIFGAKTERAVRDYQKTHGLQVDGIVGSKTWGALLNVAQTPTTGNTPSTTPTIDTEVTQAKEKLDAHDANAPGDFVFSDQALLDMAQKAYQERGKFAYDPNADALYRYYTDSYTAKGRQAMEDTMGIAQSMTGGYGSSYAQTAGQQAYHAYLQELNDVLPQLYELAYARYTDETDRLRKNYEDMVQARDTAYEDHQAQQKAHKTEKEDLYGKYQDALSRQDKAYTRLANLLKLGYQPTDEELAAAGMTRKMAQAIALGG